MRRFLICRVAALILVVFTVLPAQAATRRDDGNFTGFLSRIVEVVKRLLPKTTDEISFPKP